MLTRRRPVKSIRPAPEEFMHMVELHERAWGDENYVGRPKLAEILAAPVVVFWRKNTINRRKIEDRYMLTLHDSIEEVEAYLTKMLFRAVVKQPDRTMARVFASGHRMHIKGVTIHFSAEPNAKSQV
jgi:hypothetical protein